MGCARTLHWHQQHDLDTYRDGNYFFGITYADAQSLAADPLQASDRTVLLIALQHGSVLKWKHQNNVSMQSVYQPKENNLWQYHSYKYPTNGISVIHQELWNYWSNISEIWTQGASVNIPSSGEIWWKMADNFFLLPCFCDFWRKFL